MTRDSQSDARSSDQPGAGHDTAGRHAAERTAAVWADRAGAAEHAVRTRHLRPVWGLPGARLGRMHWPPSRLERLGVGSWGYWWQAHLLDCAIDAWLRSPSPRRRAVIHDVVRAVPLRNAGWTNHYFDDMAWLGLALQRAEDSVQIARPRAMRLLLTELRGAWTDHAGGGIWWRRPERHRDDFKNVPSNGPAAILLARNARAGGPGSDLARAVDTAEWMDRLLVDPDTGLAWDGLRVTDAPGAQPSAEPSGPPVAPGVRLIVKRIYTYCQGVLLGSFLELGSDTDEERWWERARRTIEAVDTHLADGDGVLPGHGGGDGGLFGGILARYLALAVTTLPTHHADAAGTARRLVLASAEAAWRNRAAADGGPLFGPDWSTKAVVPAGPSVPRASVVSGTTGSARDRDGARRPERDLSVQLSAWMLLEAASTVSRHDLRTQQPGRRDRPDET
ncbi:glycoside hydrolase family 76 protein [Actinoalloteichus fjordicus]|uniref:Glycosyl hydrolase n=1 Tax=Actinoalloteichus fjordicus TaxID=1612552 RepID=A0AAC9LJQ6_9PSEU|nr:glycoside hydrolase family 76 protein [Actinoalloteichus fjordicus]APU17927.1 putative glycosyl hydrolase [Actinoalloteichus fjordicus]